MLIEPNRPRLVRQEISLRRWPAHLDGFTIALLSDFHYDPYFSIHPIRAAISKVNALRPDLIVLTGDFVSVPFFGEHEKGADAAEPCAQMLRKLQSPYGVWAVMGNHDVFTDVDRVTSALRAQGIEVLGNRSIAVERNGARFWLAGVDDVLGKQQTSIRPCTLFHPARPRSCCATSQTTQTKSRDTQSISSFLATLTADKSVCLICDLCISRSSGRNISGACTRSEN